MAAGHLHYMRSDDKKADASLSIDPPQEAQDGILSQSILKNGEQVLISWRLAEEARIVRKLDFLFLPIFSLMFTWMAIDRTNVSGVLTLTFLDDTSMTHDQANTVVSRLWFGIVLLEIPSNTVLHRVGPRYWIPSQVTVWAVGTLAFALVPKSPYHTGELFGGLFQLGDWLTEHEGDILIAQQAQRADHHAAGSTLNIIKSLGFSSIRANLLNALGSLLAGIFGIALSAAVDWYNRSGYAILFIGVWTLTGLIALCRLPVHSKSSWSFSVAYLVTQAAPSWQPINVTWLSRNFENPQKRAVAYAVYSE
ncbi:hypothetical protein BDW67DRAFT_185664 [Aspergillus spinulosporus]